jgi:hypothetical protein
MCVPGTVETVRDRVEREAFRGCGGGARAARATIEPAEIARLLALVRAKLARPLERRGRPPSGKALG